MGDLVRTTGWSDPINLRRDRTRQCHRRVGRRGCAASGTPAPPVGGRSSAKLPELTGTRPARDSQPADWLLDSDVDWWTLARYGPPGFEAYVRISFEPGLQPTPTAAAAAEATDAVQAALHTLRSFTSTPTRCYAAIWEGWTSGAATPDAPRVPVPERAMLLFEAPLDVLRDTPSLAWSLPTIPGSGFAPHLAWPEDRAWCLACEVDEEIEFTVGCSAAAAEALAVALPGSTRRSSYGEAAPLYRSPGSGHVLDR